MKILHLSGATTWGGNEQQLVDSIPDLEALGVLSIIYCFQGSPLEAYAIANNIQYQSVKKAKLFTYKYTKELARYIQESKSKFAE